MNVKFKTLSTLAIAISIALGGNLEAQEATSPGNSPVLGENGKPGDGVNQCYARVSIPAVFRSEDVKIETRPSTARFATIEPVFKSETESVTTTPSYKEITAIQPTFEEQTEQLELFPAQKRWVRGSLESTQPITKGEFADIGDSGIDMTAVEPGTCFYEHFSEATLEDIPTKVLISEATEELSVNEAVLRDEVVSVVLKPDFTRLIEVPPSFAQGVEKVLIETASKRWETECGAIQQIDNMTGETLCSVDVPAKYEEVAKDLPDVPVLITKVDKAAETEDVNVKVLVTDASEVRTAVAEEFDSIDRQQVSKSSSYEWLAKGAKVSFNAKPTGRSACFVEMPAKIAEYTRKVVKTAGRFETKTIPETTVNVSIETLVAEAKSTPYNEPAVFETIQRKIKVAEARVEWKPVLCEVNFSEDIIARLQKALVKEGYEPGPIDGIMGRGTSAAISLYQKDKNLVDGGLTIETLEKLGIDY